MSHGLGETSRPRQPSESEMSLGSSGALLGDNSPTTPTPGGIGVMPKIPTLVPTVAANSLMPQGTEFLVLVANRVHFSQCYIYFYLFMFILNTFAIVWVSEWRISTCLHFSHWALHVTF